MSEATNRRTFLSSAFRGGVAALMLQHGPWPFGRDGSMASIAAGAEGEGGRLEWLPTAQTIPGELPANAPELSPLLQTEPVGDEPGRTISTVAAWQQRRSELRDWWLKFLGPLAIHLRPRPDLRVLETEVIQSEQGNRIVRQRVEYEAEKSWLTEGYLFTPSTPSAATAPGGDARAAKLPGIVVFHSTVDHSIRQPAGIEGPPEKWFGLRFAQQGYVTFCPRNFLWPTSHKIEAKQETERFQQRHPESVGMAKMLFDAQLAVDILVSQPQVDAQRIGAIGHSLGAKEVLYLAAFDDRVKVSISSEGGIGVRFSNWDAPWYLGPKINDPGFHRDHHELLSLIAPRPFLLLGGDSADGERGWPFLREALPVYHLLDGRTTKPKMAGDRPMPDAPGAEPVPLAFVNHRQGHAVPPIAEQRIAEWFQRYL